VHQRRQGIAQRLKEFLRRRVRNEADIPDIIQEVYLRLLRVPNQETIRVPEAYILTTARHVAQQHRLQTEAGDASVELDEALAEIRSGSETDPLLEASALEWLEELNEVAGADAAQNGRQVPAVPPGWLVHG
jgi:DNA-directed RNA polymerase specialized sigma24 family protein